MIRLAKIDEPLVLVNNAAAWTAELLAAVAAADKSEIDRITAKYNHAEVKSALKAETHEKCAYCEAKVTDVAYGDIEHVTPKATNRDRTFDWSNLTFACSPCNTNKGKKEAIVDPYIEDPENHFIFFGSFLKAKTKLGLSTITKLKLNRIPLVESRNREIERYANEIEKILLIDDHELKELLLTSLLNDLDSPKQEFIATCRTLVNAHVNALNENQLEE